MAKVNVQLSENGPITEMDETELERHAGTDENENETVEWVEYWLPGTYTPDKILGYHANRPHRSVHVKLKSLPQ